MYSHLNDIICFSFTIQVPVRWVNVNQVAAQAKRPHTATVALAYRAHGAACSFFVGSPAILRYAFS